MTNPWFEKTLNGDDNFFDDVIKDLDIQLDDVQENSGGEVCDCNFQNLEPPPAGVLADLCSSFYRDVFGDSIVESLTFPCDESSQLRQQSSSSMASSSRSIFLPRESTGASQFQSSSPISVLDSSSSCSVANQTSIIPKRCRSKRRRASTFNFLFAFPFVSRRSYFLAGSKSECHLTEKPTKARLKKKNLTLLSSSSQSKKSPSQQSAAVRKCTHCEVTKTPQWREGPNGPKTLCNACGVRYRSGRLFPEYLPAASPNFVPSLHSNSHKNVVEMRRKSQAPNYYDTIGVADPTETAFRYQAADNRDPICVQG